MPWPAVGETMSEALGVEPSAPPDSPVGIATAERYGADPATSVPPRPTPRPKSSEASPRPMSPTTTALSSPVVLLVRTNFPPETFAVTGQIEPAPLISAFTSLTVCVTGGFSVGKRT
jgi:hypothetical protein